MMTSRPEIEEFWANLQVEHPCLAGAKLINNRLVMTPEQRNQLNEEMPPKPLDIPKLVNSQESNNMLNIPLYAIAPGESKDCGDRWIAQNIHGHIRVSRMRGCEWGDDCDD